MAGAMRPGSAVSPIATETRHPTATSTSTFVLLHKSRIGKMGEGQMINPRQIPRGKRSTLAGGRQQRPGGFPLSNGELLEMADCHYNDVDLMEERPQNRKKHTEEVSLREQRGTTLRVSS